MIKNFKKTILENTVLVVEGKSDVAFLNSFIDTDFFVTNGSDLDKSKIEYLKNIKKEGKNIIVLTDPDFPGEKIRKIINENIPDSINVFLPKEKCIKHNKVGVAECDKETILYNLKNISFNRDSCKDPIDYSYFVSKKISGYKDSSKLRRRICEKYNLGICNTKTMIKRLRMIGISKEIFEKDFVKIMSECGE